MRFKAASAALLAALSTSLTGCALFQPQPASPLQFNYSTVNGPAAGLVRAFILNGSTVLQFIDISQAQPKVYSGDQVTPLPYQVVGQYAIVSGLHTSLRVTANGATATVTAPETKDNQLGVPTALPAAALNAATLAPAPAATPAPADSVNQQLQAMRAELEQARKQVEELKREMSGAGAGGPAIKPAALIVPASDVAQTWTLHGNRTLKDNLADMARTAGYAEPSWKAANPFMVTYTMKFNGTFLEVIGKIAQQVPALDFRVSPGRRKIDVVDATSET
jgi:FtsP/CotA-like multicopper oxidase with cupredoxin domain